MDYTTGGTFRYCQNTVTTETKVIKRDKLGRLTRYYDTKAEVVPCPKRLRTDAGIRRHIRREHSA